MITIATPGEEFGGQYPIWEILLSIFCRVASPPQSSWIVTNHHT